MDQPTEQGLPQGTRLLDRYVIDRPVARGGMAVIYKGIDERFSREVCVKLLRTQVEVGDRDVYHATYTHFMQEAALLSKLSHPNTLRIYDVGHVRIPGDPNDDRHPFQVSEFMGGGNLEDYVKKKGKLEPREVLEIVEPLAGALAEAHGQGIIHRDLKPPNILFAEIAGKRIPKLADFGIAKTVLVKRNELDSTITETVSRIALFSPRWAAPEQIASTSDSPETDVFGLAMMTAYMLAGRSPFVGDVTDTLNARLRTDDVVHKAVRSLELAKHLERFLTSVLVIDRKKRPKTALLFFSLLRNAIKVEAEASSRSIPVAAKTPSVILQPVATVPRPVAPPEAPSTPAVGVPYVREAREVTPPPVLTAPAVPSFAPPHRIVYVHDRADISFMPQRGIDPVRVRISLLPNDHANVKGLSCFVAREGQGPTAALTVRKSETLTCMSAQGVWLGRIVCAFPTKLREGFAFTLEDGSLLLPYSEGARAIALKLPDSPEWLIAVQP